MHIVARYVSIDCNCGTHLVDMRSKNWNNSSVYQCDNCDKPMICKADDGNFYYIGGKVGGGA